MSRNRTNKDKDGRPLTAARRAARNPLMSEKRRPDTKSKPSKTAAKAALARTPAGKPAVKAAAKIKARLKSKPVAAKPAAEKGLRLQLPSLPRGMYRLKHRSRGHACAASGQPSGPR